MMRSALAAAAVVACIAMAAAGAAPAATITGLGEQNTAFFDDPAFRGLRIDAVRVVVPWNSAITGDRRAQAWIDRALADGLTPLVAFEKSRDMVCPGAGCAGPSTAAYEAAISAFRARWPQVTQLTPWNEPNHRSQPTYAHAGLAAQYYNAARRACPQCTLVAGDLLDDGNLAAWLADYRQTLSEPPAVWGLHNYYDATYFSSIGLDALARDTTGEIWLTETGGIVRFSPPGGGGLPHDEQRAADSLRWLYALTARRPRVTRMYVYHWQGLEGTDFDGGLVGPTGRARAGLAVVREHAGLRSTGAAEIAPDAAPGTAGIPGASATATGAGRRAGIPIALRVSGKGLRLVKRGLRVGVACLSAPTRCTGRVVITTPKRTRGYRPRLQANFDLAPGRSVVRELPTSRRVRRAVLTGRRLQVTYCLAGTRACRTVQRRLVIRVRA